MLHVLSAAALHRARRVQIRSAKRDGRARDEVLRRSAASKTAAEVERVEAEVLRALDAPDAAAVAAQLDMVAGECAAALQDWRALAEVDRGAVRSRQRAWMR